MRAYLAIRKKLRNRRKLRRTRRKLLRNFLRIGKLIRPLLAS